MADEDGQDDAEMTKLLGSLAESKTVKAEVKVKGLRLWEKENSTISGERIIKVQRVAQQVAKLVEEVRGRGVPIHNPVCVSEFLKWLSDLCLLADSFVSSKPVGVGIRLSLTQDDKLLVRHIEPRSPAGLLSEVKAGDELIKVDEQPVSGADFMDVADRLLGREGTQVSMVFKRPDQPHPINAHLRRAAGETAQIACDRHPWEIVERVRFAEKSLLQLRFEMEEWSIRPAEERLSYLRWHQSVIENQVSRLNHRCHRLAKDLGFDMTIKANKSMPYDRSFILRDPFAQMVWKTYFRERPCTKMREWVAAVQNELRNLGFQLLSASRSQFMAALVGISMEDCISAIDIQSMIDRWNPACRWKEAETWPWPEAGHGFLDALRLAEVNLLDDHPEMPEWFKPFLGYQECCHLLTSSDIGTYIVRYSKTPGCFAIQWCSQGRQLKHAKVFVKAGGFAWRASGTMIYKRLNQMLHEVHSFLRQGLLLPPQEPPATGDPLGPDDD